MWFITALIITIVAFFDTYSAVVMLWLSYLLSFIF
jgi:hypothetical protein